MDAGHPLIGDPNVHTTTSETYRSLFPDAPETCKIEGTTHYLFQEIARTHLGQMESKPVIVAVLRNPAQRVLSSFQYTRHNRARVNPSLQFHQYVEWGLEERHDCIKENISHPGSAYVLARDIQYGQYIDYLLPWRESVGKERLAVLSFGEMVADPKATCCRLASVVGVDPEFYEDFEFEARNATYTVASPLLHSLVRNIGKRIPESWMKRLAKRAYMSGAITKQTTRSQEAEQALNRLEEYYAPYNERLAEEFDIDVSSWR
ncbi:hypothetical protein GGQ11_002632 [Salinibacter ruber]|uniref:Sulfotransferase domain-containing protein n=2 Tax=Salinibacter ruber TaxID=146919 RepID=A0A9X2ZSH9_9BACT|nr:hypothetical protein [Salinibacter ruber]MCS3952400.1 hypothetical protein [Salinibacter ruber]MCS4118849.1 hypothetical protein [Salinibacter ruber]MCS4155171.1 hypothetical protein [Salinibacter ruber]MCS4188016.1 hypothetical protein [Salinibacter ruber]